MIEVITGDIVLLELVLVDGDTSRFPQAEIYDDAGVAIGASPVDLSSVSGGLYQGTFVAPAVGSYSIIYITYSDVAHTIVVAGIERVSEHMRVTNLVQEDIWNEILPGAYGVGTAGSYLDDTIASRAAPSDILSDLVPFPGADIDATISSRSSHSAADVDALLSAVHGAGNWEGDTITQQDVRDAMKLAPSAGAPAAGSVDVHLDDIEADTAAMEPLVTTNLDATISSRGTADPGDNMGLTAAGVDAVWDELLAGHLGVGSTGEALNDASSGAGVDWTVSERSQMRQALGITGATLATAAGELQDILADTAAIEPLVTANVDATISSRSTLTQADILSDATPFPGADIDASISSRSSHTAADVDALVTASHGAGSYQTATGFAVAGDNMGLTAAGVDAVWDEPIAGHLGAGSTGEALDDASAGGSTPATIAAAVWSESIPGAFGAGEAGRIVGDNVDATITSRSTLAQTDILADATPFNGANVDASVSSRGTADPGDAMTLTAGERTAIDTELSGTHGAGLWESASDVDWTDPEKEQIRQALGVTGATAATAAGELQDVLADTAAMQPTIATNLDATVSSRATPGDAMSIDAAGVDAIFDESLAGHLGAGTAGQALAAAFGNAGGNVRDDALTYDANDRPLTLRRRIFPDAAAANASTPGGVGEGELMTVTISATQIDAAKWETLLRTI